MSMLKAKINAALAKIGTSNGTAPRQSQDPLDALAHEYNVASSIVSIAEKRKDMAKKALLDGLSETTIKALSDKKTAVAKSEVSDNIDLGSGAYNSISAQVKIGASYLDTAALRVELKKYMSTENVDKMFENATKRRDPSVTINITELEPD